MRVREGAAQRKLDNRQSPPHSQPRASTHAQRGDRLEAFGGSWLGAKGSVGVLDGAFLFEVRVEALG